MVLDANKWAQDPPPFVVRVLVCDMKVEIGVHSLIRITGEVGKKNIPGGALHLKQPSLEPYTAMLSSCPSSSSRVLVCDPIVVDSLLTIVVVIICHCLLWL